MATTNNDQLIRNDDGEPLCKRTKYTGNEVCIDLKSLMSYTSEIDEQPTKSSNLSTQNEDAGDSGFQDFTSNDSPSSKDSNSIVNDRASDRQTTFSSSSTTASESQFASIHLNHNNSNSNLNKTENQSQTNGAPNDDDDDDLKADVQDLNDNEDSESIISDISCLSSLSDLEDVEKWQSNFGPVSWVQQQITSGTNPRQIIDDLLPNNVIASSKVDNLSLWRLIVNLISEPPKRKKLPHVNNLEDVVSLVQRSKKIVVLTGAGVSTSCGIPDFRSRDGIYARLSVDFPDLPDPQAMFDINYFRKDQRPFYKFAKEIYPGQFKPSISHKFIKSIESNGKLLRNYTQNIDTLEKSANIERVITCHGSFSTASCTNCKYQVDGSFIKDDIFAQRIPRCPRCPEDTDNLCVLKPDIVFFGESLPEEFHDSMAKDKEECDLLIVIGSSLKVKPVALIPTSIPADIPQILINREHLSHMTFDVELLGDCDIIVQELCNRLGEGWNNICVNDKLTEVKAVNFEEFLNKMNEQTDQLDESSPDNSVELKRPSFLEDSYVCIPPSRYVFKGAELYSDSEDDSDDSSDEDDNLNQSNSSTVESTNKVNYELDEFNQNQNSTGLDDFSSLNNNETELSKSNQFSSSLTSSIDTNNNS